MPSDRHTRRRDIASRLNKMLSEYGLENAVSGGKFDDLRQTINSETGFWSHSSMNSKPSRLLVHLETTSNGVSAVIPEENSNGNFSYANTAHRSVGGLCVRIAPVIHLGYRRFEYFEEWEWLLWFIFPSALKNGSSGQVFDGLNPRTGEFNYLGEVQPYIEAGLVAIGEFDRPFTHDSATEKIEISYDQATAAIQELIQVNPVRQLSNEESEAANG
ncbi:hypothetical protein SV7mr_49240 [Stieleria bergensis]|uniref:Uncharacterized protein n=1 Tax=Stieleria bergensis TaxID=2528025 RepID=A0A517T1Y2_9BACT|nr:hypothetical protein SV7mr_49240 [Planctomycetes bacterium SV_7m_r]